MIFTETKLKGAYIIELEKLEDERGFFSRSWDKNEFKNRGLNENFVQCNISYNKKLGTLRGMHYQKKPCEEVKIVRCTRGKIFDVIIDLRGKSPTKYCWFSLELTEDNHKMIYVPKGFAHGFQTLEDNAEVFYQMSTYYNSNYSSGVRCDDPLFNIKWPIKSTIISKRDAMFKLFQNV